MSQPPIFIASVFFKVVAWALIVAVVVLVGIIIIFGRITTLDLCGMLISAVIVAYIVHLWIYYGKLSREED